MKECAWLALYRIKRPDSYYPILLLYFLHVYAMLIVQHFPSLLGSSKFQCARVA